MTTATTWTEVRNWAADREGSIHDDDAARARGFSGGLVPGDVPLRLVGDALTGQLGDRFVTDGGFVRHTFARPLYSGERARVVIVERVPAPGDESLVEFTLEADDGTVRGSGLAGLGSTLPWARTDLPESRPADDGDAIPGDDPGLAYDPWTLTIDGEQFPGPVDGVADVTATFSLAHRLRIRGREYDPALWRAMRAGMNARYEALHHGPLRHGGEYRIEATLAEKFVRGRYGHRTLEVTVDDAATGDRAVTAHWGIAWVRPAA